MTTKNDALICTLVDLIEAVDATNTTVRQQAERRRDQTLITVFEVCVLRHVLRHPGSGIATIAESTGLPHNGVATAAKSLGRRGLLTPEMAATQSQETRFRASETAVELRDTARDLSAQTLRYALAGISTASLAELEAATSALAALGAALGWQDIHRSYRDQS